MNCTERVLRERLHESALEWAEARARGPASVASAHRACDTPRDGGEGERVEGPTAFRGRTSEEEEMETPQGREGAPRCPQGKGIALVREGGEHVSGNMAGVCS